MPTISKSKTETLSINIDYGVIVLMGDNPAHDSIEPMDNNEVVRLLKVFGTDTRKIDANFMIDGEGSVLRDITVIRRSGVDGPRTPTKSELEEIIGVMNGYMSGKETSWTSVSSEEDIMVYVEKGSKNGEIVVRGSITEVSTGRTREMSAQDSAMLIDVLDRLEYEEAPDKRLRMDGLWVHNEEDGTADEFVKIKEIMNMLRWKYFRMRTDS